LSFDIPPGSTYDFEVLKRIYGVGVSVDLSGIYEQRVQRDILALCRKKGFFSWCVPRIVEWCKKLDIGLEDFYVQFVWPQPLGPSVSKGKAVVGRQGRALLQLECDLANSELCLYIIESDPSDVNRVLCEDIIPHELMHILNCRSGRWASVYPIVKTGEGEWLDLFAHLWIDGHLEERGLPHLPREERVRELAGRVGSAKAEGLASVWWGKQITMREAIQLGIEAGLTLKPDCPLAVWYDSHS
jgi:hypothetical protein